MEASLKQLRYFVTIAEFGKMAEAAKTLHISQPALSAALSQLEVIWQTQLFVRHKAKGMTLTRSGELLLRHSRQLLQQSNSLDDYARGLNEKLSGDIRIGCFATLAPFYIPQLLRQTRALYPDLNVEVVEFDLAGLRENLLNGQLELALSYSLEKNERIHLDPLVECPPYVLLPDKHPLAASASLTLKQLTEEPVVLLDLPHSDDYFLSLFAATGKQPHIAYRSRSFEMIRCMVASGHGYSLLNQRPGTDTVYTGGKVKMVPLKKTASAPLQIVIARHVDVKPSLRASALADIMRQIVNDNSLKN